jgi:hypothetical protein
MSTPFIHTRKRSIASFSYPEMLTWLCFLPLAGAFAWGVFWAWETYLWGKHDGPVAYTAALIGLVAAAYVALAIARGLSQALLRLAKDTDASLQCSVPEKSNLLIIRTSGDEASAVLALSQILSWFVSRLWSALGMLLRPIFSLLRLFERLSQLVPAILIVSCFASLLLIMAAVSIGYAAIGASQNGSNLDRLIEALQAPAEVFMDGANKHDVSQMIQMGLFGIIILIGGTFALVACFVLPALILLSIVLLPFGPESALSALLVEVSVEPVPPGRWCISQYASAEEASDGLLALAHSAAYDDPRVLSLLASWIVQSGS